jgi:hypothetical protein
MTKTYDPEKVLSVSSVGYLLPTLHSAAACMKRMSDCHLTIGVMFVLCISKSEWHIRRKGKEKRRVWLFVVSQKLVFSICLDQVC